MFWSPDGREIAFFSEGKLKRMDADGGPVQTLCDSSAAFSGAWGSKGTILFEKDFTGPIVAVPATGGTPVPVTAVDASRGEIAHYHPAFLPDGRHFLFVAHNIDPEKTSVMLASLDSKDIRRLFYADSNAVFADPGFLLFGRNSDIFAWRFDPQSLKLVGDPAPAFEQVRCLREDNGLAASAAGNRVVFVTWFGRGDSSGWIGRGASSGSLGAIGVTRTSGISPDGQKVAVTCAIRRGQNRIWVLDVSRGTSSRITSEATEEFNPAWFLDGERLSTYPIVPAALQPLRKTRIRRRREILVRTKQDKILRRFRRRISTARRGSRRGQLRAFSPASLRTGGAGPVEWKLPVLRATSRVLFRRPLDGV